MEYLFFDFFKWIEQEKNYIRFIIHDILLGIFAIILVIVVGLTRLKKEEIKKNPPTETGQWYTPK